MMWIDGVSSRKVGAATQPQRQELVNIGNLISSMVSSGVYDYNEYGHWRPHSNHDLSEAFATRTHPISLASSSHHIQVKEQP